MPVKFVNRRATGSDIVQCYGCQQVFRLDLSKLDKARCPKCKEPAVFIAMSSTTQCKRCMAPLMWGDDSNLNGTCANCLMRG
jgi:hypothetical protein